MAKDLTPEQLLALLEAAIREAPVFVPGFVLTDAHFRWLGRVDAILLEVDEGSAIAFEEARDDINSRQHYRQSKLMQPIYDAIGVLQLQLPSSLQGAFIPPGDTWNGFAALLKPVQTACDNLLIVDPYVISTIFTELVPHAAARIGIQILTVQQLKLHAALLAMSQKWQQTHPAPTSPVEVRYAPANALHDRLIILDDTEAWLVSQSIKDIAKKSAASVTRADSEMAQMKAQHYQDLWKASTPIS